MFFDSLKALHVKYRGVLWYDKLYWSLDQMAWLSNDEYGDF